VSKKKVVIIRELDTGKEAHRIETELTGGAYERFYEGLLRKVDFERFYIDEGEEEPK
jgi:hypothetical protein